MLAITLAFAFGVFIGWFFFGPVKSEDELLWGSKPYENHMPPE